MNMDKKITYDGADLINILETRLDRLKGFQYDRGYKELLGERLTDKLLSWDKTIRGQKDSPLTVVVCGEFKRGKSSLINAILGEDVVTTNITTETITTNKISYGNHKNEIVLRGGRRIQLADDELKCDKLKEILADLPDKANTLEIKRPIELLKQITIIDTPGLGDAMRDFSGDVAEALRQADAVIYVFSALYPLSLQEQMFIRTAIKPQKYTDMFLVANFCDTAETVENCERMRQVIIDRISDIMPGETPIMISALDECCRIANKRRPCEALEEYLGSAFDGFRKEISELITEKIDMIIPDRMQRLISGMADDVSADIQAMRDGLESDKSKVSEGVGKYGEDKEALIREQEAVTEAIDTRLNIYKSKTVDWMTKLIELMQADASTLGNIPVEDIKKYYPIYCTDTLEEAFNRCLQALMSEIYDELDKVSGDISKQLSINTVSSADFRFRLNNKTWTKGDNVAFIGDVVQGMLGAGQLLGSFVGGLMRKGEIKQKSPDMILEITAQYPALLNSTISSVSKKYDEFANNAKVGIAEYFSDRINDVSAHEEEAEMVARQSEEKQNEIRAALDEVSAILDDLREDVLS